MINTRLREKFLQSHVRNCTAEELFDRFTYYYSRYQAGDKHSPIEKFSNCTWYLKRLLTEYPPAKVVTVVRGGDSFALDWQAVEWTYVHLMRICAQLHDYFSLPDYAAYWARKTLEMINYFHPQLNKASKVKILSSNEDYQICKELLKQYGHLLNEELHLQIIFPWERFFYFPKDHANQNFKDLQPLA